MQPQQPNTTGMPLQGSAGSPQMQTAGLPGKPTEVTPRNPNSSQNTLMISELREGMAVMNDGSFRAVISCRSINFDLMSDREREAVEYSYQNFLNSLYFPVQIFIRSERVDIGPYLDRLVKIRREQDNMLLGVLMEDYINFIDALSQETNIMNKRFYVIVPFYPSGDVNSAISNSKNMLTSLFKPEKQTHVVIDRASYDKAKAEVTNRVNVVLSGLFQMGVRGTQLNTKQLGELYYNSYNPDTAVRQPLGDYEALTGTFVEKGQGNANQPHLDREQL
jgi:type IV secretory pathway VirB4 component